MQKISKPYLIITIIVIAGIAWLIYSYPKTQTPQTQPTPAQTTSPTDASTPVVWPSQEVKKQTEDDSNQYYAIHVAYPVTSDPHIADGIKSFVDDQIAQFKQDTSWATDPTTSDSAEASSLSLDITYREEKGTDVETYIFTIDTYTGGAHGLEISRTFAYDKDGKALAVTDLFTNGADGLKTIATYVEAQLTKGGVSDPTWISGGAGPTADNYQNFIVSDTGVTFIFDPYQVAAYSEGSQNIVVPLSVFKSIANPALFPIQ